MKRHLFLIINNGGETNPLPNVARDKTNYLDFFQSPEGGYWNYDRDKNDKDITVYENDFTLNILSENIRFQKNIQAPYDYIVIVFCGHGFSENGEKWIEAKPTDKKGDHISLSQIKEVCRRIRTLFIADSCLSIPERQVFTKSIQFNRADLDVFKVKISDDTISLPADFKPGSYTFTFEDNTYAGLTFSTLVDSGLNSSDISFDGSTFTIASDSITASDYIANISSVSIDGSLVEAKGLSAILFDTDGNINLDAEISTDEGTSPLFSEGAKHNVVIESTAYPKVSFSIER